MHADVKEDAWKKPAGLLRDLGHDVQEVSFPTLDHVVSSYYVIATAEASANLARFDGVRYGHRDNARGQPRGHDHCLPNRGPRARGEAAHPPGHVRAALGLPGRVLPAGAEDPHRHPHGFREGIRGRRPGAHARLSRSALRAGQRRRGSLSPRSSPTSSPARPTLPGFPPCRSPRAWRTGLPIGMQFLAPRLCGGAAVRRLPAAGEGFPFTRCARFSGEGGARDVRLVPRPGSAHPASHAHEGILRVPRRLRR